MTSTTPPSTNTESWTTIGQDVEDADVYGNIIPIAMHDNSGHWSFWFGKRTGQRDVNPLLIEQLNKIGEVVIVRYSSNGDPMSVIIGNDVIPLTGIKRAHLHRIIRMMGQRKR